MTFIQDGQKRLAYFNSEASLVAVGSFTTDNMSLLPVRSLREKFGDLGLQSALEISYMEDDLFYYLNIHTKDKITTAKISSGGYIEIVKKKKR